MLQVSDEWKKLIIKIYCTFKEQQEAASRCLRVHNDRNDRIKCFNILCLLCFRYP